MASPGVSVRPIKLISGKSPFCETFFDNVEVPIENLIGEENKGWSIAKYLLTHERTMIGADDLRSIPLHVQAKQSLGETNGRLNNELIREKIARLELDALAYRFSLRRAKEEAKAGQPPGAKSSFFKYYGTELNKRKHEIIMAFKGVEGSAWAGEDFNDGYTVKTYLRTKGNSIEGGTSEIQLNIISKRILGLPS
jgi:alkylation response protein AidB-like acyl-CoA dehydrogenase